MPTEDNQTTVAGSTGVENGRLKTRRPQETTTGTGKQSEVESKQKTCPECDGNLKRDGAIDELHCEDCGVILDNNEIDRGPEWTSYNHSENRSKSRVGSPLSESLHDNGLSTQISWKNTDAKGNGLSRRKKQKMGRLRKWDNQSKKSSHKDKCLAKGFTEIRRMSSALGFPKSTTDTASMIFRQAEDQDLLPGRSIEGVATAALHIASVIENIPRSYMEMEVISRVKQKEIIRTKVYLERELGLELEPVRPESHIPRIGSDIGASQEHITEAKRLAKHLMETEFGYGKSPSGLATAALYAGSITLEQEFSQREIAKVAPACEITIRDNYKNFIAADPKNSLTIDELEDMNSHSVKKALARDQSEET